MKKWIISAAVVLLAGAVAYGFLSRHDGGGMKYRFVTLEKGNLESVVSATGTLNAVTTVEVGTQISGKVSALYVDFNDKVKKGEVIARIDDTLLKTAVADAEATLERSKADLEKAQLDFDRIKKLHAEGISADADYNTAQYNLEVAKASVKSADASLTRARQNLAYATITAPVSGTVVERDVDVGQTVAASMSAPKLYLIANDLSEMQILASVDESDIGQIKEGQNVRFNVKAYADRTFTGTVKQVRLQSTIDQNVVSYTVVISVKNADRKLLPGMTATVEFLTAEADNVLKVPNAALRFRPTEEMVAEVRARHQREHAGDQAQADAPGQAPRGAWGQGRQGSFMQGRGPNDAERPKDLAVLWYLDKDGNVAAAPVRTGITDGQFTQVTGKALEPGMQIIAGITQTADSASVNPFQSQSSDRRHFGGF